MVEVSVSNTGKRVKRRPANVPSRFVAIRVGASLLSSVAPHFAARWLETLFTTPPRQQPPQREIAWMAGAKERWVRFDENRQMPLRIWGEGPTVLLVHGFGGRGSQMGAFVQPLLEQGFRVVTFDFVAHGQAGGKQTLLPEMADALAIVAQKLGSLHGVIAHSLGASATSLAVSRGMEVRHLAYISPPNDPEAYLFRMARKLGFSMRVAGRAKQRLEDRFGVPFEQVQGAELVQAFGQPGLILHDSGDTMVPIEEGERLQRNWAGSQILRTRDLGHNRILRDPEVIAKTVAFVATS